MEDTKSELEELIEKSKTTDITVLLSAKEKAKRLTMDDPSASNLTAYKTASQMLEAVVEAQKSLKDYKAVLEYAEQQNRKLGKSKLYHDISNARLKKQPDGTFKIRDVDNYLKTLSALSVSDSLIDKVADGQKARNDVEIRRITAVAATLEFEFAKKRGEFILKDAVYAELASRALLLSSGIKTAFEVHVVDLLEIIGGDPKKSEQFVNALENIFDEALHEYSQVINFEMDFDFSENEIEIVPEKDA